MARRETQAAVAAPSPASTTSSRDTIRVRGRAHLPPGVGSSTYRDATGTLRPDPGRFRAGFWWPRADNGDGYAEHEVTLEQFEELLEDSHLEIRDEHGALLSTPKEPPAPTAVDDVHTLRARVAELEAHLRAALDRAARAEVEARAKAQHEIDRARVEYQTRITELEGDVRRLSAHSTGWLTRPETSDERRAREASNE